MNVGGDPDNLARRLVEDTRSFGDADALSDGICLWPILLSHRLIDHRDPRRRAVVASVEETSADEPDVKDIEIAVRNVGPFRSAVRIAVDQRPPFDGKRQAQRVLERQAGSCSGGFNPGHRFDTLLRRASHVVDGAGPVESGSGQRRGERQHVVCVETGLHVVERHKGTNEQTGTGQKHNGQRHFHDDECAAHKILTAAAGANAAFL